MGWGPSNDEHMIAGARWAAEKADCTRRQVGAMIFDADTHVVSAGRNGSPPGKPGCASDGACPRGRLTSWTCPDHPKRAVELIPAVNPTRSQCVACEKYGPYVAPGSSYDTGPGSCIAIHDAPNALARASWERMKGGTLASTDEPCDGCRRIIQAYPLSRVIWPVGQGGIMEWDLATDTERQIA
jgi:dCMP deaminase